MLQMNFKMSMIASALAPAVFLSLFAYSAAHEANPPAGSSQTMGTGMMGGGMTSPAMNGQSLADQGLMLQMPRMDPAKGRMLFASKGCVVCHSVNGVGGEDAPKMDASTMEPKMDPFDFAAKMWRGAPAMIMMQHHELGGQIEFTGDELADIIAFAHSPAEQQKFSAADIPEDIKELMEHEETSEEHGAKMTEHKD